MSSSLAFSANAATIWSSSRATAPGSTRVAKELQQTHSVDAEVLPADLVEAEELLRVEQRATDVDILVNNAGFGTFGSFHELDIEAEANEVKSTSSLVFG